MRCLEGFTKFIALNSQESLVFVILVAFVARELYLSPIKITMAHLCRSQKLNASQPSRPMSKEMRTKCHNPNSWQPLKSIQNPLNWFLPW